MLSVVQWHIAYPQWDLSKPHTIMGGIRNCKLTLVEWTQLMVFDTLRTLIFLHFYSSLSMRGWAIIAPFW
jgi:hypothetical protein